MASIILLDGIVVTISVLIFRAKEVLKTAAGEMIPPAYIEGKLIAKLDQFVSAAVVIGDNRKFLTVLFCLKVFGIVLYSYDEQCDVDADQKPLDALSKTAQKFLAGKDVIVSTVDDAIENEKLSQMIDDAVEDYNRNDAISHAQHIAKWRILPRDFSVSGGELTGSLKVRNRRCIFIIRYVARLCARCTVILLSQCMQRCRRYPRSRQVLVLLQRPLAGVQSMIGRVVNNLFLFIDVMKPFIYYSIKSMCISS